MNTHDQRPQPVPAGRYGPAVLKALGLHLLVILMFGISFSSAPEFEPARPIVQATLVQLESSSPAMTATEQRIAGEAERTAAQRHEAEQLARQQREQEEAAQRAEQQRRQQAEREREAQQQEQARREAEQQAREQAAAEARQREAEAQARREAEQRAQREAAEAERRAAEQARQREEEARRQAAAEAERREAAERARREAEAEARRQREAAEERRRAQEEERARALAELLASEAAYQRAQADRHGDQVAASYDDLIRRYVSEQWRRPPTARNDMVVEVRISMVPTGQITDVVVTRSSGDPGFDQSAVQAVRNVGSIPEMQQLSRENPATFDRLYRQRTLRFRPEDLAY
ncbi:MAG: cell envelope integrity protein TolA [Gammaproteobacteria bacterium]|nr:cell envelope integrity protein TolA [Gammaproteobacteria bacterium]